jgi:ATP-binding cassette subfamily B protein
MSEDNKTPMPPAQQGGMMGGSGPVAKAKDFKGTLRRLLVYLEPHRVQLSIVIIFAVLSTGFNILGPKILGKATTKLFDGLMAKYMAIRLQKPVPSVDFIYIGQIILVLVVLYLISALFGYIQQYQMAGVSQKTVFDMRKDLNDKLSRLPLKYFDSKTHGEIMSRVTNDIDNISTTLQQSMTQLISSICTIVGVLIMMLSISEKSASSMCDLATRKTRF